MGAFPYDLIIFDCDGTLVDSEYLNNKVTADVLNNIGLTEYTVEKCLEDFAGNSWSNILTMLRERHSIDIPSSIVDDYIIKVQEGMKTTNMEIKGALEFVARCNDKCKIAVGSNGERSNVLQELEVLGFMDLFSEETVYTKIQVKNPKPAPDLFLFAAEQIGNVAADKCLVFEDSPTGTKAGVAAGMEVWGFIGVSHDPETQEKKLLEAGASRVFSDFIHIREALGV